MKNLTFFIFIFVVLYGCSSKLSEKEQLQRRDASGYYGELSDNKKIYDIPELIKNKNTHLYSRGNHK